MHVMWWFESLLEGRAGETGFRRAPETHTDLTVSVTVVGAPSRQQLQITPQYTWRPTYVYRSSDAKTISDVFRASFNV